MKPSRILLVLALTTLVAGVAYVGQTSESTGAKMVRAAERFLASLTPDQRQRAVFGFDDKERFNWHFIPLQHENKTPKRKGVRLEEMNPDQREAALELLRSGTSHEGFTQATTIMSLESILHDLEKGRGAVRNPGWYF